MEKGLHMVADRAAIEDILLRFHQPDQPTPVVRDVEACLLLAVLEQKVDLVASTSIGSTTVAMLLAELLLFN